MDTKCLSPPGEERKLRMKCVSAPRKDLDSGCEPRAGAKMLTVNHNIVLDPGKEMRWVEFCLYPEPQSRCLPLRFWAWSKQTRKFTFGPQGDVMR